MKSIEKLINEIYVSCQIPFQLKIDDVGVYSTPGFNKAEECIEKTFNFKYTKCCIILNAAFSYTIDLLGYCLESKLEEMFLYKQKIITSLLSGKEINKDIFIDTWPALNDKFNLINIYVENNIEQVLSYIKEGYLDSEIEVFIYKDRILLIGPFEYVNEHVISINETINDNFSGKCYISYCTVNGFSKLKNAYDETMYKLDLAIKYKLSDSIFDERKLILEGIVDSVSEEVKERVFTAFNKGLSKLDHEMVRTIEVFFKCGLNLSDASKELYIHRNTLIYRLDKIQKYTSYDIRDFNNAVLFKIVFFIWKQKNKFTT